MIEALLGIFGKLLDWTLRRPSKAERKLAQLRAEQEITKLRDSERVRAKNAAFERAVEHGMRLYREGVERDGRRWLLTDELNQTRFATKYAEEHWREFLDAE